MRAFLGLVGGEPAPGDEEAAAERTGIARLPRQVVHLHVLDEVAFVAHRFETEAALIAAAASQRTAVGSDELIRVPKV